MNLESTYPEPHSQTAGRVIDGEALLILSDSAEVNVLNDVGSRIYELVTGERSLANIIATIVAEYDVSEAEATADVIEFIDDLVANNVLVLTSR